MKKTIILLVLLYANIMAWGQTAEGLEMQRKANAGDVEAQFRLGDYYFCGSKGFTKDEKEGIKWFRKSAEQGYAEAQYWLGDSYWRGEGVAEDEK